MHERLSVFLGQFIKLLLKLDGRLQSGRSQSEQIGGQRFADAVVADVDQDDFALERQKLEGTDRFFLVLLEPETGRALAFLETVGDALQEVHFGLIDVLLLGRARFFEQVAQFVEAVGDDFQIGEQQLLAKAPQFIGEIASREARQDN